MLKALVAIDGIRLLMSSSNSVFITGKRVSIRIRDSEVFFS